MGLVSGTDTGRHTGDLVRDKMTEAGWNIAETAERLGCERAGYPLSSSGGPRARFGRPGFGSGRRICMAPTCGPMLPAPSPACG